MASVFVVEAGEYSDRGVSGVFSTRELADIHAAEIQKTRECANVTEWTLDDMAHMRAREVWSVVIYARGAAHAHGEPRMEMRPPGDACQVEESTAVDGWPYATVHSPVSAEHAMKVATELRQKWLREGKAGPHAPTDSGRSGSCT